MQAPVAGRQHDAGPLLDYRNVYYQYVGATTPTQIFFKGLKAGTQDGEAWSISLDGTRIGGMGPVDGGRSGQWPYRYDVASDTIIELPTYADTAGSVTNGLVYGLTSDGGFGSGQNFRGQECRRALGPAGCELGQLEGLRSDGLFRRWANWATSRV